MGIASARRAPPELLCLALAAFAFEGGGACRRRPEPHAPEAPAAREAAIARLAGQVVDGRARPVPEARLLAFRIADGGAGSGEPARAIADLDGRFAIERLTAGSYRLLVEAAGFPTAEAAPLVAPATELVLHVAGEGRSIFGRVALAGAPAPEARVALAAEAGGPGGPVRETLSRADGRFAFSGLGDGSYALRASRADLASPTVRGVTAERDGANLPPLALAAAQRIAGRLVQDAGAALAGFEVRAESAALAPGDDPLPVVARTDGSGAFTIGPLSPGSYRLTSARAGYVLRRAPTVDLEAADVEPPTVLLELLRGAQIMGRVTDARGGPAASAHVRCVASAMDDLTVESGPLPLAAEAAALPSGAGRALGSTRSAIADAHGRFTVGDLIPGRYRVEVAHAGSEPMRTDELTLAPGERRDLGALALRDGFPVEGRVVDDGGAPLEGARIVVTGGADDSVSGLYAVTDGAGAFSIALPAGHYRLTASAPGHGGAGAEVEVRQGAPSTSIALRLARAEATLEGLVRDTGGRPLGRARLLAWPLEGAQGGGGGGGSATPIGTTSADVGGHFRMADLPAGELRIEVQHPDYPRVTLSATPGQFASLTVPFPGGITGEARVRATGAAVARGRIEAAGPDGAKASAELQRTGSFRLPRLAPGHWRLSVSAPGYHPAEQELDVPASASLGEPSVRDLRVDLDPA